MSTTATTTALVMPDADAALVRAHLPPGKALAFNAALTAADALAAAMFAVDAAGYAGADHPAYDDLWRVYTQTVQRNDARWRARVAAAWRGPRRAAAV
jgi:hypothetical protein